MGKYGKIVILAGGPSSEREISLRSGRAVLKALRQKRENAELVDVGQDIYNEVKAVRADVVFIALHGKFGEDGTVQSILEEINLPYTGSGVHASRLALDKVASKELFYKNSIDTPDYRIIEKEARVLPEDFETAFVVKPQFEGSSIGLTVVREKAKIEEAIEKARQYSHAVLVEKYVEGRELTVGIFDDKALPVIEIVTKNKVYDFDAKYVDRDTKYEVPANLREDEREKVQGIALRAHRVLDCRDFSRVDMRLDKKGKAYVLEVNTIPGMTERSLLPKAAGSQGISFEELCMSMTGLAYGRKK